jgi:hypothetical protein
MSEINVRKILFLAANPSDTSRLRLDQEVRQIDEGLRRAAQRDRFRLITKWAVTANDLRRGLLDEEPEFVHFAGHGGGRTGLVFEGTFGEAVLINAKPLANLFSLCAQHVKCVVLNGCYSLVQANAIAKHVDYVIGMKRQISDDASIKFAIGFYDAIGSGKSVDLAYRFGRNAIELEGISEHLTPILKKKGEGPDASPSFALGSGPPKLAPSATDELISILKLRADRFLALLEKGKRSIEDRHKQREWLNDDPQVIIKHLDSIKNKFMQLHLSNVDAIRDGKFILSHEITGQIHCLLYLEAKVLIAATEEPGLCAYLEDPVQTSFRDLEGEVFSDENVHMKEIDYADISFEIGPQNVLDLYEKYDGFENYSTLAKELDVSLKGRW